MNDELNDGLIDDTGFELGQPTHVEMLQQYNRVLEAELDTTRLSLRKAHNDIAGLIVMNRESARELAALKESNQSLKVEHERLRWTLSEMYRRQHESDTSKMTYVYGDHTSEKL